MCLLHGKKKPNHFWFQICLIAVSVESALVQKPSRNSWNFKQIVEYAGLRRCPARVLKSPGMILLVREHCLPQEVFDRPNLRENIISRSSMAFWWRTGTLLARYYIDLVDSYKFVSERGIFSQALDRLEGPCGILFGVCAFSKE